jgi:hypothetical protein
MQALPAPAESLCIVEMKTTEGGVIVDTTNGREQQVGPTGTSFLNIGLQVKSLSFVFLSILFFFEEWCTSKKCSRFSDR